MFAQPRTFPCPNCNEMINESMQQCRYCSATIDPQAASVAAELQSKVGQACSDASYLRTAAGAMWVFLGISLIPIPFLSIAFWGFVVTFLAVMVMLIRWQIRFGGLPTGDPDYGRAKRAKNVALLFWLLALPVGLLILTPFAGMISAMLSE